MQGGYAVTGGQDTVINVFSLDNLRDDPDYTLVGHSENVCALDTTTGGTIISGSWDRCVAFRWDIGKDLMSLGRQRYGKAFSSRMTFVGTSNRCGQFWLLRRTST